MSLGGVPRAARRVPSLDGIRGLAVLWVFAFHANALLAEGLQGPAAGWGQSLAEKGLLGVQLFFLLSGFLLVQPWIRARALGLPRPRLGHFYARRARRILPAYWLHLALLFGVVLPLLQGGYGVLHAAVGQANLVLHPLLLQFAHPGTSTSLGVNMALWSLTIEAQFYLLLPLLAPLFTGRRVLIALPLTLGLSLTWKSLAPGLLADWVILQVPPSLLVFFDPISGRPMPFPPGALNLFIERQLPGELMAFGLGMAAANLLWVLSPEATRGNGAAQRPGGLRWTDGWTGAPSGPSGSLSGRSRPCPSRRSSRGPRGVISGCPCSSSARPSWCWRRPARHRSSGDSSAAHSSRSRGSSATVSTSGTSPSYGWYVRGLAPAGMASWDPSVSHRAAPSRWPSGHP